MSALTVVDMPALFNLDVSFTASILSRPRENMVECSSMSASPKEASAAISLRIFRASVVHVKLCTPFKYGVC